MTGVPVPRLIYLGGLGRSGSTLVERLLAGLPGVCSVGEVVHMWQRGLVQDGRLIRLRIHLLDRPGALAELTQIIAAHRANIVDTLHNRAYYGVNLGDTVIDITMETRGREQVEELLAALTAAGYKHSRVL